MLRGEGDFPNKEDMCDEAGRPASKIKAYPMDWRARLRCAMLMLCFWFYSIHSFIYVTFISVFTDIPRYDLPFWQHKYYRFN